MSRPRRPITNDHIALPPAVFVGGKDRMIVKHDPHDRYKRSYGVVMMSTAGLEVLRSHMAPRDKVVLMTLISKLQWSEIDYEAERVGDEWHLNNTGHDGHVLATIKESGIVTTGLSPDDIADRSADGQDAFLEILAEAKSAMTGSPIERDRARSLLHASNKERYSVDGVSRSISNLESLGIISGRVHAGPDKWYFILNPFFYCNGPTFMRDALIRHLSALPPGSVVNFSEDISQARPPRRRQTNAELRRNLGIAHDFIIEIAETQALPAELLQQARIVLRGNSEHG